MPRQVGTATENAFRQGLITEASGLNFPEHACTETYDCVFNLDGCVERRLGFDFEKGATTKTIDRTNNVVTHYLWKNVAGDGNTTVLVLQVGSTLYFYETDGASVSAGAVSSTIDLTTFLATNAPSPSKVECQFSSGTKYLIVTHPYCDPFYVSYDPDTSTATGTTITIKIRDFEGDKEDDLGIDTRPTSTYAALDVAHTYNLMNQGWTTSALTAWDSAQTTMPSNADQMWRFKDSNDAFDASNSTLNKVFAAGNSPAPKGHFILTLTDQDRDAASGLSGVTAADTSFQRPSTSAWYAGRVFYAGINYTGYNSKIYFTQIIERDEQHGLCYQANDPTSEYLFDLLPSDGGVISIPEAGTIYKLVSVSGGLVVFANNGIWTITGSTGLGFKADDYTVQKISSVSAISGSSFVDVNGLPAWWNTEGIYILTAENGALAPKSLTLLTIKTFYDAIPTDAKLTASGHFDTVTGVIQWVYRDASAGTPTETYTYTRILNYNINTNAFYPWIIPDHDVSINGVFVLDSLTGTTSSVNVVDDAGNQVVDDSGNTVIAFTTSSTGRGAIPVFKYIVSYPDSGSYKFTLAETRDTNFLDWSSYATGVDYSSYFITGYMLHGGGIKKFQPQILTLFTNRTSKTQHYDTTADSKYHFQTMWDYANTGGTGRWSSKQLIWISDDNYDVIPKRLRIRGSGRALQFKVTSIDNYPFSIAGWVGWETSDSIP